MTIAQLSQMTWEEVRDLNRPATIAILPVGAVEAHGPHLPLTTDVVISEAMARAGAQRLAALGHEVLLLPTVAYTAAEFAAGFPGTISVSPATVTALLTEIAASLASQKLRTLAIANAHLDPAHITAIEAAVAATRAAGRLTVVFPDITKKPWALKLTEEFKSGACHAGRYESSIVMAQRPELVREDIRVKLAPNPRSLADAIRAGVKSFEDADGPRAYFGFPADASSEEGDRTIELLGSILEEAVLDELVG